MPAYLLALAFLTADTPGNPVFAAAKKRQEAIRSIEVVCGVVQVREPFSDHGRKTPEVQTAESWTERIVFDGHRSRLETLQSTAAGKWLAVETCDGTFVKSVSGPADQRYSRFRSGQVRVLDRNSSLAGLGATYHFPLLLAVRGVTQPAGWTFFPLDLSTLSPQENELKGEWESCMVYGSSKGSRFGPRIWANPNRGYSFQLLRSQDKPGGTIWYEYRISNTIYPPDSPWLPEMWEDLTMGEGGKPAKTVTVVVKRVTINADWPDSECDLTFPPGTRVHDQRDDGDYFVEKDGTLRPFRPGVDDAMPTPPPVVAWNWLSGVGGWLERHFILLASLALTAFAIVFGNMVLKKLFPPK